MEIGDRVWIGEVEGIVEEVEEERVLIYWGTSDNTRHTSWAYKGEVNG